MILRSRKLFLITMIVATIAVGGFIVYQRDWIRWPEAEQFNPAEIAQLGSATLAVGDTTPASVGWPQWRGPARDGVAPSSPLRADWLNNPPTLVWSVPIGGGYSSFAVVGNQAFTQDKQGDNERIICLNTDTGELIWEYSYPVDYRGMGYSNGPRATPTVHEGRVYTVGATGLFLCLELQPTGPPLERWRHQLPEEFRASRADFGVACSPLIEDQLVIVQPGGKEGTLAAFDRISGELIWKAGSDSWSYSSPIAATMAGVRQIIAATGQSIIGVRASDGVLLWRHPWKTQYQANIATPIAVSDYVFVSSGYGKGCALLRVTTNTGGQAVEQVYFRSNRVMRNHFNTCVYKDGFLYGFDDGQGLRCVDFRKGELIDDWEAADADNKRIDKGCVILAGDMLIGLTTTGTLFLADANPAEFHFRGQIRNVLSGGECWALPVLVDGRIYLRDAEKAVCLDVR